MTTLLSLYWIGGALLSLFSIPLIFRKIPPNSFYGVRNAKTLGNRQTWFNANAFAGKRMFASGIVFIAAALLLYLIPNISLNAYSILFLLVVICVFGVAGGQIADYIKKLD
jgi:uncharacterized membrane protein